MANLHVDWFKNIPSSDRKRKEEFEGVIRNSTTAFTRLQEIIKDKENILTSSMKKDHSFESPTWAHHQAFHLGKLAAYEELLQLLGFLDK